MSSFERYTTTPGPPWEVAMSGDVRFTWEYDPAGTTHERLAGLYQKGKDRQWDQIHRIDWDEEVDPGNRFYKVSRSDSCSGAPRTVFGAARKLVPGGPVGLAAPRRVRPVLEARAGGLCGVDWAGWHTTVLCPWRGPEAFRRTRCPPARLPTATAAA